ncbi:hypothetical protein HJD18_09240 [Thermoleophilia bacterium SCSIO 60948]|nr:hypothetical protein HJD18_09240 [Thermoleophilia bacterium SCSIO 60948]
MRTIRMLTAAMVVALLAAVAAAPATAQTQQNGLVNVNLEEIDVGLPISVAANVCDLDVAVLAEVRRLGETACTADAESGAVFGPGGNSDARQEGLVNVNVSDVVVKVPVSVAANICDVAVNVLAQQRRGGPVSCDAVADSDA